MDRRSQAHNSFSKKSLQLWNESTMKMTRQCLANISMISRHSFCKSDALGLTQWVCNASINVWNETKAEFLSVRMRGFPAKWILTYPAYQRCFAAFTYWKTHKRVYQRCALTDRSIAIQYMSEFIKQNNQRNKNQMTCNNVKAKLDAFLLCVIVKRGCMLYLYHSYSCFMWTFIRTTVNRHGTVMNVSLSIDSLTHIWV